MTEPIENPTEDEMARWHRTFAPSAFNHTWSLLDEDVLTREQEEEMLAATMAQRYHWYAVGDSRNRAIADWQVARVATVIGYVELARRFAERSLETSVEDDLGPFVVGFAHEAIARAAAEVDDIDTFAEHLALARLALADVSDPEERDALTADLAEMSEE